MWQEVWISCLLIYTHRRSIPERSWGDVHKVAFIKVHVAPDVSRFLSSTRILSCLAVSEICQVKLCKGISFWLWRCWGIYVYRRLESARTHIFLGHTGIAHEGVLGWMAVNGYTQQSPGQPVFLVSWFSKYDCCLHILSHDYDNTSKHITVL